MIEKGFVSTVLDGGKKVTVVPAFSGDVVSHELVVPFFLVGTMEVNKEVIYCSFPDNSGMVLANLDGTWNHKIDGDVDITGKVTSTAAKTGNLESTTIEAGTIAGTTVTASGISLAGHTHEYSHDGTGTGTTSKPK